MNINPFIEIAALNRIADLYESGFDLPNCFRQTATELEEYYQTHYGTKLIHFDLTKWVNDSKPSP